MLYFVSKLSGTYAYHCRVFSRALWRNGAEWKNGAEWRGSLRMSHGPQQ